MNERHRCFCQQLATAAVPSLEHEWRCLDHVIAYWQDVLIANHCPAELPPVVMPTEVARRRRLSACRCTPRPSKSVTPLTSLAS